MRKALLTLVLLFVFLITYSQSLTPRQLYTGLFEAVQLTDVFPDNKIFVDATPKRDPKLIMKDYEAQKGKPGWTNGVLLNLLNHYQVDQL